MADPALTRPESYSLDNTESLLETILSPYRASSKRRPPAFSEIQFRDISEGLRRTGEISWSKTPRLYAVLFMIDSIEILDSFISEGASDLSLPFTEDTLPKALESPPARLEFLKLQQLVLTKALDLEKATGKHRHFHNPDDIPLQQLEDLGRGSTGFVDRVLSTISQKEYARRLIPIKRTFGKNKDALRRFESTLGDLKKLAHRHIIQVVGSYNDSRFVGVLMTPIANGNLTSFLKRVPQSAGDKSCMRAAFGCLTAALNYLHENGVLHGDIRPQNVLIRGQEVLLSDFSMSTFGSDLDLELPPRTLQYRAPEVVSSRLRADMSSDMWSLGCVFVEMWAVLMGQSVSALFAYLNEQGSTSTYYHLNLKPIAQWCDDLLTHSDGSDDHAPKLWIDHLLLADGMMRWTTKQLSDQINEANNNHNSKYSFSGRCCIDVDGSDDSSIVSDYSLLAEETQSSPDTSRYAPTVVSSDTGPQLKTYDQRPAHPRELPDPNPSHSEPNLAGIEKHPTYLTAPHGPSIPVIVDAVKRSEDSPSLKSHDVLRDATGAPSTSTHHYQISERPIVGSEASEHVRSSTSLLRSGDVRTSLGPVPGSGKAATLLAKYGAEHVEHRSTRPDEAVSPSMEGLEVSNSRSPVRPFGRGQFPTRVPTVNVSQALPTQSDEWNIPLPPYSRHQATSSFPSHSAAYPQPGLQVVSPNQLSPNTSPAFISPAHSDSVLPDSIVDDITAFDLEGQCGICDKVLSLDETSYQAGGRFFCHYHFVFVGGKTCEGCHTVILPLPSESPDQTSLQRWHVECYMLHHHFDLRLSSVYEWQSTVLSNSKNMYEHVPTMDERQSLETHLSSMADGRRNIWNALFAFCWRVGLPLQDLLMTRDGMSLNTDMVERVESVVTEFKLLFLALNKVNQELNEHNLEGLDCQPQMTLLTKILLGFLISTVANETVPRVTMSECADIIRNVGTIFKYLIRAGMRGASRLERLRPSLSKQGESAPGPLWRFFFKLNGRCCARRVCEKDKPELKDYLMRNNDVCPECKESLFGELCAVRTQSKGGTAPIVFGARYHWRCQICPGCGKPVIEEASPEYQSRWKQRREKMFSLKKTCTCVKVPSQSPELTPVSDHLIYLWHTTMARFALLCKPVDWVPRERLALQPESVPGRFADEYGLSWKPRKPLYVENICKIESLLDVGNLRHSSYAIQHWLDTNKSVASALADHYKPFTSSKKFRDVDYGFFKHCVRILELWEDAQAAWPYDINELGDTAVPNELDPQRLRSELDSRARMELEGNNVRTQMFELEAT